MTREKDTKDNIADLRKRAEKTLSPQLSDTEGIFSLSPEELQRLVHELRVHQIELEMQNEDLRQSQMQLEELKDKYLDLYDFAPVGYVTLTDKGLILEANLTAIRLLGVEGQKLIKKPFSGFVCQPYGDAYYFHLQQVFETESGQSCEIELKRKDGTLFFAQLKSLAARDESGHFGRCRTVITDITERKRSEEALRESEGHYRSLFEQAKRQEQLYLSLLDCSADPIVVYDLEGKVRYLNAAHTNLFGWTMEEAFGKRLNTVPESDQGVTFSTINQIVTEGVTTRTYDTRRLSKEGRLVDVSVSGARYLDHEGKAAGMVVILRDITDKKRAEVALRDSEEKYRRIVETANEGVWEMDAQFRTTYVNRIMAQMLGYTEEEMLGRTVHSFMYEEDLQEHHKRMENRRAGQDEIYERRFRRKDGSEAWLIVSATAIKGPEGNFAGSFAMLTDITDRKKAEEALRESEEKYRLFIETANEAVFVAQNGVLRFANRRCIELTGYSEAELLSKPMIDFIHPDDREMVVQYHQCRLGGYDAPHTYSLRIIDKDGVIKWLNLNSVLIRWDGFSCRSGFWVRHQRPQGS